jgi:broad specificity phosphatase PhoE
MGAETRRFIGHLDVPLSPLGEAQIAALAERLRPVRFDAIYCSDLVRTRRSAEILAAPHRLQPIEDPALREFAMGDWDGLTADEIRALDAVAFTAWMADVGRFQFPRGESLPDLQARVLPAFQAIADRHAGGTVAVVAHGGSNRAILCHALGLGPERLLAIGQDYAALSVLERGGGGWRLRMLNQCEPGADPIRPPAEGRGGLVVPSRG